MSESRLVDSWNIRSGSSRKRTQGKLFCRLTVVVLIGIIHIFTYDTYYTYTIVFIIWIICTIIYIIHVLYIKCITINIYVICQNLLNGTLKIGALYCML